jgi:hypothetical protein
MIKRSICKPAYTSDHVFPTLLLPAPQDMACDTFLKISNKCKRKFVVLQLQEAQPFVGELLDNLTDTIQDLLPHQIQSFYESVGLMISAEGKYLAWEGTQQGLQCCLCCDRFLLSAGN